MERAIPGRVSVQPAPFPAGGQTLAPARWQLQPRRRSGRWRPVRTGSAAKMRHSHGHPPFGSAAQELAAEGAASMKAVTAARPPGAGGRPRIGRGPRRRTWRSAGRPRWARGRWGRCLPGVPSSRGWRSGGRSPEASRVVLWVLAHPGGERVLVSAPDCLEVVFVARACAPSPVPPLRRSVSSDGGLRPGSGTGRVVGSSPLVSELGVTFPEGRPDDLSSPDERSSG